MREVSAAGAIATYRRLQTKRLLRGRLAIATLILLTLPIVGTAIALPWARDLFESVVEIYIRFLLPFLPTIAASTIVSEEIEQRTFTFLFARPAPRSTMVLGKYIALTVPLALAFVVAIALVYGIANLRNSGADMVGGLGELAHLEAAVLLGVFVFSAVATLIGAWFTHHPFVAALGYFMTIETLVGSLPIVLNVLAISYHVRNVAGLSVSSSAFFSSELHVPGWVSLGVLGALIPITLGAACSAVSNAEYRTDRA